MRARWQQHISTKHNNLASSYRTTDSCALKTAYQHKAQQSHCNFSHWFRMLGQGVLTFYNTHARACGSQAGLTASGKHTNVFQLFLLAHWSTRSLNKLMSTDLTVAANSNHGPVTSTRQTFVRADGKQTRSFCNKRNQDFSILQRTHTCVCGRWTYHTTSQSTIKRNSATASSKRTGQPNFSDAPNTLRCVGNSTSAPSTTISLQLFSRDLGDRPRRPVLLRFYNTHWSHSFWQREKRLLQASPVHSQEYMTMKQTDVHRSHSCCPAHTRV